MSIKPDIPGMIRRARSGGPKYGLALREATRAGDAAVVAELVDAGWRDSAQSTGETCLMMAARVGPLESLRALLPVASPSALDQSGMDALMHAAVEGRRDCVEALAPMGTDRMDRHGATALMHAARNANLGCVEVLLAAGADPHARTKYGETALMMAANAGCPATVAMLLPLSEHEALDTMGRCALMSACLGPGAGLDLSPCVDLLLDAGFDPARANTHGRTALMIAVSSGRIRAVEAILARTSGWDWRRDVEGFGPFDLALSCARPQESENMVELLAQRALLADPPRAIAEMEEATSRVVGAKIRKVADFMSSLARSEKERVSLDVEALMPLGATHAHRRI